MTRKHLNLLLIGAMLMSSIGAVAPNFFASPNKTDNNPRTALMLNGKVTDENALASANAGLLNLVTLQDEADEPERIPFYIRLIRVNKALNTSEFAHFNMITEIELSTILKYARDGDKIIIDPAEKNSTTTRKVITVRQNQYLPQWIRWIWPNEDRKDGC